MRRPFAFACVLLALACPAHAQAFKLLEVSGGYAFLNDPPSETTFRRGWTAGAAIGLTNWLSAAGEVAGHHAHVEGFFEDTNLSIHSATAGLRASVEVGPLREFVQVLAGVARASGSRFGVTERSSAFAVQPGVAVDLRLHRRLWIRGQVDIRYLNSAADSARHYRVVAAVVYRTQP